MNKITSIQCNRCKKDIHFTQETYRRIKKDLLFPFIWCADCEKSFKEAKATIDKEIKNPTNWQGITVKLP
jgi:hypothetical protein